VISAAFIGPGTITTALKSGSLFKLDLLWTVLFSILACYVLQEAASRITIATGLTLSEAIGHRFNKKRILGIHHLLIISIVFGCLAYQAGNMTGALTGIRMATDIPRPLIVAALYLTAFVFLWNGRIQIISRFLGTWVFLMALIFILLSVHVELDLAVLINRLFIPRVPQSSGIYIIALIGTTIVPYNLFLGSGISQNQNLSDTRFGLASAILLGGLITLFILLSGTLISNHFSFEEVISVLETKMGKWAGLGFAFGLFAAGLTSSITAPLAAAITAKSVIKEISNTDYQSKWYSRGTWITVLSVGTLFSLLDYEPDMLIVIAQAVNGLILPFVAYYLYVILNDRVLMKKEFRNRPWYKFLMLVVIGTTIFLGIFHFTGVLLRLFIESYALIYQAIISGLMSIVPIGRLVIFPFRNMSERN